MGVLQFDRKNFEGNVSENNRDIFFAKVGTRFDPDERITYDQAMAIAGTDYLVIKDKSYDINGQFIGTYHTKFFDKNGKMYVLGSGLSEGYSYIQNYIALQIASDLLQGNAVIECAGTLGGGKKAFICLRTDGANVLGEEIAPYILIINSFDGSCSIKIILTPVRVFCSNCVSLAIQRAQSIFTVRHTKSLEERLNLAHEVLLKNTEYLELYRESIEEMAKVRFSRRQFVDKLVPAALIRMGLLDKDGKPLDKKRNSNIVEVYRNSLLAAWNAEDAKNQGGTLVNVWNAITDFESHYLPMRNKDNGEIPFYRAVEQMSLANYLIKYASEMVNYKLR